MSAFSENFTRPVQEQQPFRSPAPFATGGSATPRQNGGTYVRQDGRRAHIQEHYNVHGSPDMRNILAGRDISHQTSLSQKRLVKPQFEKMENGTFEKNLIEAEMHRGHYDANRFCAGSKDYRRMKHGPGWAGRPASDKTQKDERIAASNPMYGKHHFFLSDGKKPEVRAGTDDMMRTLGWDQLADQERAGAPSAISNKWRDDIHVPRGPAMTANSHIMRPDRNPITGYNMGEEFKYLPGERRMKQDSKNGNIRFLERTGQETDTKERVFGHVMDLSSGKAAQQQPEGVRVGIAMYENTIKPETIFPNRNTMAVGGDRNEARKEYEMNLAKFHTGRGAPNEALREKNKLRNRGVWHIGM